MGLDIENVHVLARKKGTNQLDTVRVNPYIRLINEGEFPVSVQAGRFYTDGGDRILVKDLASWVKPALGNITPEALIGVGLTEGWEEVEKPPETKVQNLKTPTSVAPPEPARTVVDVVHELDPQNDEHWTKDGKPDLQAVTYGMDGVYTTRADIEEATRGFRRPGSEPVAGTTSVVEDPDEPDEKETSDGDSDSSTAD